MWNQDGRWQCSSFTSNNLTVISRRGQRNNYNSLVWGSAWSPGHPGNWWLFHLLFLWSLSTELIAKYTTWTDNKIIGSADMYRIEKAINFTKEPFWLIFTSNFYFNNFWHTTDKSLKYRWSEPFLLFVIQKWF